MTLDYYQERAISTAVYPEGVKIVYPTLGLTGEAGEVADKVKKVYRDNNGVFSDEIKEELKKEIGDVMWYCATLSKDLGFTLREVAETNIQKLQKRRDENKIHGSGDNR